LAGVGHGVDGAGGCGWCCGGFGRVASWMIDVLWRGGSLRLLFGGCLEMACERVLLERGVPVFAPSQSRDRLLAFAEDRQAA